jgi:hypothetical protein
MEYRLMDCVELYHLACSFSQFTYWVEADIDPSVGAYDCQVEWRGVPAFATNCKGQLAKDGMDKNKNW